MERTPGPCTGPRRSRSGQQTPAHMRETSRGHSLMSISRSRAGPVASGLRKVPVACYTQVCCLPVCCRYSQRKLALLSMRVLPQHCSAVLLVVRMRCFASASTRSSPHRNCQAQSLLVLISPRKLQPASTGHSVTKGIASIPACTVAISIQSSQCSWRLYVLSHCLLLAPCSPASDRQKRHGCLK